MANEIASASGTNEFHGTIYDFIRNTDFNAPGFFKPTLVGSSGISVPFQKPTFQRNQYGFSIGGPILRNRLKIYSVRDNARVALAVIKEHGSLDAYLWSFVDGQPIVNRWTEMAQVPAKTTLSDQMSEVMSKRGFRFVGSTICYAFMQATGMVNDHLVTCFKFDKESGHAEH